MIHPTFVCAQILRLLVAITLALDLVACLGSPVPLPRRNRGATGEEHKLDLTFLKPGVTSRSDIAQNLGWLDVGYPNPYLFWGRWSSSAMGYWVVAGGGYNAAAAGGRIWGVHNVVISFDDHGLVRESRLSNEGSLLRTLHQSFMECGGSPLDLSTPIVLDVEHWHSSGAIFAPATLELAADSLDLQEFSRYLHYAHFPPYEIIAVTHSGPISQSQNTENPAAATVTLVLQSKTPLGEKITLRMAPHDLATLVQYLDQTARATVKWE
jgi:hypothetical protein